LENELYHERLQRLAAEGRADYLATAIPVDDYQTHGKTSLSDETAFVGTSSTDTTRRTFFDQLKRVLRGEA